ncbi:hypothetical protein KGQ24_00845 [Patescibacteria group bacterium]|nr:hypothetical protein [Patescibacteria group bacterium]
MRVYANLIQKPVLHGMPVYKTSHANSYVERIFNLLLVYDQLPDNDLTSVLEEMLAIEAAKDFGFSRPFSPEFKKYAAEKTHAAAWAKISHDYHAYMEWETRRRNKTNPYYVINPDVPDSWDNVPDFARQKAMQPFQYDPLYRDSSKFAEQVFEITAQPGIEKDKDIFRARVNGILVPSKIVFALSSSENPDEMLDNQTSLVNAKLSLDALKQAGEYLSRAMDSVDKISWRQGTSRQLVARCSESGKNLAKLLSRKINETERSFMLYAAAVSGEQPEE